MLHELAGPEACVDAVIARVGHDIRVATPLAIGKPNHLLNAFYRRARANPDLKLTVYTALTLERPRGRSELERRFLGPFVERVFAGYPDLDYEADRVADRLPANVRVHEFYLAPAKYLDNAPVQRDYICSNYTHVARDLLDRGVNVLAQQVAERSEAGRLEWSLSANPDLTLDLMDVMRRREAAGEGIAFVAQTNGQLPFMYGDAVIDPEAFHFVVRDPALDYPPFGAPKMSVSDTDYMIGLHCSAMVRDGGELQVGIGAVGDALVRALLLRHERNDLYRDVLARLALEERFPEAFGRLCELGPFERGLFAGSEMLIDGFLHLYRRGVIRRRVYDHPQLQRLLNLGVIDERVTPSTLDSLIDAGVVDERLSEDDVELLSRFGVFRPGTRWEDGEIAAPDGTSLAADLRDAAHRAELCRRCLGERLRGGAVMHGAFFLGDRAFYRALRELPDEERRLIEMRRVSRINELYGHEEIDRLHRRDARFVNSCMMLTLTGAAASDGLEDGRVLSGVGGQFNFVDMAQALPDGHSVLNLRATRTHRGRTVSNIVWNYGHLTVPRHMRDVYVTEYGVALVRGKTDEEVIRAILAIADSRFQDELMSRAKAAGKLDRAYRIPPEFRDNLPSSVARRLEPFKSAGLFPPFPFGCDFTEEELAIGRALRALKARVESPGGMLRALARSVRHGAATEEMRPLLARMGLDAPSSLAERVYRRLLCAELGR